MKMGTVFKRLVTATHGDITDDTADAIKSMPVDDSGAYATPFGGVVTTAVIATVRTSSGEVYASPCKVYWCAFYTSSQSCGEGDLRDGTSSGTQRFRWGVRGAQYTNYMTEHCLFNPPIHFTSKLYATLPSNARLTIGYIAD